MDKPFLMCIEDVFNIEGRGTVVTGRVERGVLKKMDGSGNRRLEGHPQDGGDGHRNVPQAAGRRARATTSACCCAARRRKKSNAAWFWPSPASIKPHTKFKAEVYVLSKDEGGRHTPFFNNYRPQFYFRTSDVTGT
jgi:elongation factor Tu